MNRSARPMSFNRLLLPLVGPLLASGCALQTPDVTPRPVTWAEPVEAEGLPNLHRVSPDLYRSARPNDGGYAAADRLGVETIVNLRCGAEHVDRPEGPDTVAIPVWTGSPSYDEARRFFGVVDDPERTPVLLHCYHGADRTGAFTALYRIHRQGWSEDAAIAEMTGGGYDFHTLWGSLIPWVREAPEL